MGRTDVPKALALILGNTYRWAEKLRIIPEAIGDTNGRKSISLAWRRKSPLVEWVDGTAETIWLERDFFLIFYLCTNVAFKNIHTHTM